MPKKCLGGVVYYTQCESCGPSSAYIGKTINTLYERFYGPNGHLHPNSQKSALLEHLGHNINPLCEFNIDNVKILDICNNDLKLSYIKIFSTVHCTMHNAQCTLCDTAYLTVYC